MRREELGAELLDHAYLEGDFVLRSGRRSSYYLDKYRFETQPDVLAALGEHLAAEVSEHEPDAVRLAGPELGAVALAASASLSSGIPFVIVRSSAKEYGTANRLEGLFEAGERVCLIEDVVRSEEHTSEFQSPTNLVCRLLLELAHFLGGDTKSDRPIRRLEDAISRRRENSGCKLSQGLFVVHKQDSFVPGRHPRSRLAKTR